MAGRTGQLFQLLAERARGRGRPMAPPVEAPADPIAEIQALRRSLGPEIARRQAAGREWTLAPGGGWSTPEP